MHITSKAPEAGPLETSRLGPMQLGVIALCALIALLDGFDTQAIGYVAPNIAEEWGIKPSAFGPIFSAGLFGLMAGAFAIGPLADKVGRRKVILFSTAAFGLAALATALAETMQHLLLLRFLTGIGLGAVLLNIIALTSEYAPARLRATAVMVMFCGFPLGSTIGGLISAPLMEAYSWRAVFIMGGVAPLALLPLLLFSLPESVRLLAVRGGTEQQIGRILKRISPDASVAEFIASVHAEKTGAQEGLTVPKLFADGRATSTILLWVIFFMSLLVYYFLVNWLPTLIKASGLPLSLAIICTATLNLGGVVGAIVLARLLDRFSPFLILGLTYAATAVFVAMVAYGTTSAGFLMVAAALAGFGAAGGQIGSNALAATLYPTAIRATGVGWALGVGRIGAITGPLIAGALLAEDWSPKAIILSAAIPSLAASAAAFLMGATRRTIPPERLDRAISTSEVAEPAPAFNHGAAP